MEPSKRFLIHLIVISSTSLNPRNYNNMSPIPVMSEADASWKPAYSPVTQRHRS